MTSTWAMKKKTNGKLRGRLNARGYEQIDGQHYTAQNIAAPVTNEHTVRVVMALMCANPEWVAEVVDVEGAFLQGRFTYGEVLHTEVSDGMTQYYDTCGHGSPVEYATIWYHVSHSLFLSCFG